MTSKEGGITCEYTKDIDPTDSRYCFIIDMLEDVLDKVEEISIDETFTIYNDKGDFEVINSPKDDDSIFTPPLDKKNDYLHTIEEDCVDSSTSETNSVTNSEDVIQIINVGDSDGIVNEKLLLSELDKVAVQTNDDPVDVTDSSVNKTETIGANVSKSSSKSKIYVAKSDSLSTPKLSGSFLFLFFNFVVSNEFIFKM
ncbi:uncharacterized protein LOC132903748 [Amyelois transitella]|uniref:uncharacterized protein LOC132903748 n=1 Tax=Amyelois transitella TaxID=680683 RepID=UPI0029900B24|nr:uncharacterized protein LOC132903748 [Amyelois transitella]